MKTFLYIPLFLLSAVPTSLLAESKWYAQATFGPNLLGDQDISYTDPANATSASSSFDTGFIAGGAVGYRYEGQWRTEVEIQYRTSPLDSVDIPNVGSFSDGDYSSLMLGLNAYYDFETAGMDRFSWFAGAGIAWLQEVDIDFESAAGEQSYSSDDLGFQLMLGARYDLTDNWYLVSDLRYLSVSSIDMTGEGVPGTVSADYDPLAFNFGIGFSF